MARFSPLAIAAIVILCIGGFVLIFIGPCIRCKSSSRPNWRKRREIEKRNQIDEIQRPSSSLSSHSSKDIPITMERNAIANNGFQSTDDL